MQEVAVQSLSFCSQFLPENPLGQVQEYELT